MCASARTPHALLFTALPPPLSRFPIHSVRRHNRMGADGCTAVAQALQHVPQLQMLALWCALATARPARDGWRAGVARSFRARW